MILRNAALLSRVRVLRIPLFIAFVVALSVPAFGNAKEQFPSVAVTDNLSQIAVISARHTPPQGRPSKQIVLIQDTHLNFTAQLNLAKILRQLAEEEDVFTVFVEGGWGDMRLSEFKMRGDKELREQAAYKLLEDGMISGEEYLDITTELPLLLWGAENQLLYNRNVSQWFKTEGVRRSFSATINELKRWSGKHEERFFDGELRELIRLHKGFRQGQADLSELTGLFDRLSKAGGVSLDGYPQVEKLIQATRLQAQLNTEALNADHRNLIEALRRSSDTAVGPALTQLVRDYQNQKLGAKAYFSRLMQHAEQQGLSKSRYAALERYTAYLELQEELAPALLLDQVDGFVHRLKQSLAASPEAQSLVAVEHSLSHYANLALLKWTPSDYKSYKRGEFLSFSAIVKKLEELNDPLTSVMFFAPDTKELDGRLDTVVEFYQLAEDRNRAIVNNVISKMNFEEEDKASLVVGGFHTPGLVPLFLEQGAEVIVMTPFVDEKQDDQRYAHILKFKAGLVVD